VAFSRPRQRNCRKPQRSLIQACANSAPTGTSKWNPIEHHLFSEISKNWAAEPLDSYQKILNFLRTTTTKTALAVSAYLDRAHYPTGLAADPLRLRSLRLRPHKTLPAWNYTITPNL
jgi:Rhodopirellula transposase DDE domain